MGQTGNSYPGSARSQKRKEVWKNLKDNGVLANSFKLSKFCASLSKQEAANFNYYLVRLESANLIESLFVRVTIDFLAKCSGIAFCGIF